MYAVVELGGRQWKVEPGTRLSVNRLAAASGQEHIIERVLFAHDGKQAQIGEPYLVGARVVCEVVDHALGPKVISYHYRRRENWRKTVGHRQRLTHLLVKSISCHGMTAGPENATAKRAPAASANPAQAATKTGQGSAPPAKSTERAPRVSALKPQVKSLAKKPVSRPKAAPKEKT